MLNHSSIDPELTGKACSFWHFQFEANTAMKMKAIANYIKKQPDIKKVYLLNQDYAHGKQWAHYGREMVGLARPDIQFVGEALHPIGRVKDFAPYLAKVKSTEADSVITGNWGQDMTLLLKAAGDAGYNLRYFNHSAGSIPGTVLAVSQAKQGQLTWVAEWHPGQADTPKVDALAKTYKAKTGKDFLAPRIEMTPRFLAAAINKAQSTDPVKVARALEDLTLESVVGPVRMRGEDHQLLLPQVVNTIAPVDGKAVKVGWEGTNYGFRTDAAYTGNELAQGTDCKMIDHGRARRGAAGPIPRPACGGPLARGGREHRAGRRALCLHGPGRLAPAIGRRRRRRQPRGLRPGGLPRHAGEPGGGVSGAAVAVRAADF